VDIYDGDSEPMIFHGKTFTSKVSLREVCHAIMKYGFVASPYPIIISAEVHCGLAGQDMIAEIMGSVFGEALVKAPVYGRPKIENLPSPEDLKGRILLKVCFSVPQVAFFADVSFQTKNLYFVRKDSSAEGEYEMSGSTSASASSTSDSEAVFDQSPNQRTKLSRGDSDTVKGTHFIAIISIVISCWISRIRGRSSQTRVQRPPTRPQRW
jgi:phosphatidylinositol phospholipase C delta